MASNSRSEHQAAAAAVAEIGRQEAALPRRALQGFVELRRVQKRHSFQAKDAVAGDCALAGFDLELPALEDPPGLRQFAVRDEPVVKDVAVLKTFGPFPLKREGAGSGQNSGPGLEFRRRGSPNVVITSGLGSQVVFDFVRFDVLSAFEVIETHIAAGFSVVLSSS